MQQGLRGLKSAHPNRLGLLAKSPNPSSYIEKGSGNPENSSLAAGNRQQSAGTGQHAYQTREDAMYVLGAQGVLGMLY